MQALLAKIREGDYKSLARGISIIENNVKGARELLMEFTPSSCPVIGITGSPGAGKSTLTDALIAEMVSENKKVAVLCVDPSSPFNLGAVLGDRIRMSEWYNHPGVFIRSLASRGSLGGLHPYIIEITDLLRQSVFDYILIETVGVGQSEIEIAGMADTTVVVVVPEGGDEIQTMKAGIMEIGDIFVVNKADRPDADRYLKNLRLMLAPAVSTKQHEVPVISTVASERKGVDKLFEAIKNQKRTFNKHRNRLLAERAFLIISRERMKDVDPAELELQIAKASDEPNFNLYRFAAAFVKDSPK